jgi:hypothetical protein
MKYFCSGMKILPDGHHKTTVVEPNTAYRGLDVIALVTDQKRRRTNPRLRLF